MIAQHTLTHAIQYLQHARHEQRHNPWSITGDFALLMVDPHKPCAAYGLAKRRLRRCGSLAEAIKDLEKQLEQS